MRYSLARKFRLPTVLAVSIGALALPASAGADPREGGWHDGWGWGHMAMGSIMMLLFWGGLIVLIVLAVRWLGNGPARAGGGTSVEKRAIDILEERFARGEIDKEEFEERRRLLSE